MTRPRFDNTFNFGHVGVALSIIVAILSVSVGWAVLDAGIDEAQRDISFLEQTQAAYGSRLRAVEQRNAVIEERVEERFNHILSVLSRIETQLAREGGQ